MGHYFWKCTQVNTKDERLKILKDKFPNNCSSCGFKHDSQQCNWMSECPDDSCNVANGKHNKSICPKFVLLKPTAVQQVALGPLAPYNTAGVSIVNIDGSVVELNSDTVAPQSEYVVNIEGKSVALPTAVYTANNQNA